MRKLIMFNRVSADGCFAGREGGLDWVVPEPKIDEEGAAAIPDTDTILFGRKTYEMFESFWPHALEHGAPDPQGPVGGTEAMVAMARFINEAPKIVFSRSRKQVTWTNSKLVRELDPDEIAELKRQPGKNLIIFGSGSIVSLLTEHQLIDEYQLVVTPVLLGSGKRLVSGLPAPVPLKLLGSKAYPSGNVVLRYAPAT